MVGGGWIDADEMVREGPVLYTFIQLSFKLDFRAEMAGGSALSPHSPGPIFKCALVSRPGVRSFV